MTTIEDAVKIRLDYGAKVFRRQLLHPLKNTDAGIVYEYVQATKFLDTVLEQLSDLIVFTYIAGVADGSALTKRVQLANHGLDLLPFAAADAYECSAPDKGLRNSATNAAGTARNYHYFALKVHGFVLSYRRRLFHLDVADVKNLFDHSRR
jgi:hypothetical protein